jgi:hypothetical protein
VSIISWLPGNAAYQLWIWIRKHVVGPQVVDARNMKTYLLHIGYPTANQWQKKDPQKRTFFVV